MFCPLNVDTQPDSARFVAYCGDAVIYCATIILPNLLTRNIVDTYMHVTGMNDNKVSLQVRMLVIVFLSFIVLLFIPLFLFH